VFAHPRTTLSAGKNEDCRIINQITSHFFLFVYASEVNLFRVLRTRIDVQAQTLGVKVELVAAAIVLQNTGNVPGILNFSQLDVTPVLLDSISDKLCRTGFTLSADNEGLLLLASLVDQESSLLSLLLGDLFRFDGSGEFGRECKVL